MTCSRIRCLLSYEPKGAVVPRNALARRHLATCGECRRFWQALQGVDAALAAWPLATPPADLSADAMALVARSPRQEVAGPFSQAFVALSAGLLLCALVGGAWLLQHWTASSPWSGAGIATGFSLNPTWPSDASAWLSSQSHDVAQAILAAMAGVFISLAGAAIGFRASGRGTPAGTSTSEQVAPPH